MSTPPHYIGKYELCERLGQGGTAEVWKALDPHLQRYVAIKMLHANLRSDPHFIKRFEREARAVATLRHPNIVQIHDFQVSSSSGENNPTAYMAMEYVEGTTLTHYIHDTSSQGIFPSAAEIIHLFTAIGSAVDYAHQRGILHRDIKPANILLDKRNPSPYQMGEPILSDFGIVKLLGTATGTLIGSWMGTPSYISPEQAQGHPGTERSDIYSLGVILYEICTGVRPIQGDSILSIIWHHINSAPPPPALINPYISPALAEVILRSLAKDPSARFQSGSEMAQALALALTGSSSPLSVRFTTTINEHATISPLSAMTPLPASQPSFGSITPPSPVLSPPKFPVTQTPSGSNLISHEQGDPIAATGSTSSTPSVSNPTQNPGNPTKTSTAITAISHPLFLFNKPRGRLILLIVLLGTLLVGSGLGTLYLLPKGSGTPPITDQTVGQAIFISSGQLSVNTSQGLNDQLHLELHNIKAPAPGKSYYAWLLADPQPTSPTSPALCQRVNTVPFILLGKLIVDHGNVDLFYKGNSQHSNLLGITSSLLITEEDTNNAPLSPSLEKRTWRYSAEIPQQLDMNSVDSISALDNLRCLLYEQPDLLRVGIHGGLAIQFLKNVEQILKLAQAASDSWSSNNPSSIPMLQNDLLLILSYIDGPDYFAKDIPGKVRPSPVDPRAQIGLISFQESFASYYDRIHERLRGTSIAQGVTPNMHTYATQAINALLKVHDWLMQVHSDARQLAKMSPAELLQPPTQDILKDMRLYAENVYHGYIDPVTGISQPGVLQIDRDIQNLITFEIRNYNHILLRSATYHLA